MKNESPYSLTSNINSESVANILMLISECEETQRMAQDELDFCDRKTQDLLHEFELEDLSYHERAKLGSELRDIRQRRRNAKDIIETTSPLLAWITSQTASINALKRVLGDTRKIETKHANRVYFKRANDSDKDCIIPNKTA